MKGRKSLWMFFILTLALTVLVQYFFMIRIYGKKNDDTLTENVNNCPKCHACRECPTCPEVIVPECPICVDEEPKCMSMREKYGNLFNVPYDPSMTAVKDVKNDKNYKAVVLPGLDPPRAEGKPKPWRVPEYIDDEKYGEFGRYRSHLYHAEVSGGQISLSDILGFLHLFTQNPNHCGVVELGTLYGSTTLILAAAMAARGCSVTTFDHFEQRRKNVKDHWPKNAEYILGDVIGKSDRIRENRENGDWDGKKLIVEAMSKAQFHFMDNGNKFLEFQIYAEYVKKGDYIILHDWDFDKLGDDIMRPYLESGDVKYWDRHFYDTINSKIRVFIKMNDGLKYVEE